MIVPRNLIRVCLCRTVFQPKFYDLRFVSTSSKKGETVSVHEATKKIDEEYYRGSRKNQWSSYGFDYVNQQRDVFWAHTVTFMLFFGLFGGGIFLMMYYPDAMDINWAQREAYIQLRRREVLGLPLIDPNYVDPATVILPPDETLGDDDIVI